MRLIELSPDRHPASGKIAGSPLSVAEESGIVDDRDFVQ